MWAHEAAGSGSLLIVFLQGSAQHPCFIFMIRENCMMNLRLLLWRRWGDIWLFQRILRVSGEVEALAEWAGLCKVGKQNEGDVSVFLWSRARCCAFEMSPCARRGWQTHLQLICIGKQLLEMMIKDASVTKKLTQWRRKLQKMNRLCTKTQSGWFEWEGELPTLHLRKIFEMTEERLFAAFPLQILTFL